MKQLFAALAGLLLSAGSALGACPGTPTDCPSPTYNAVTARSLTLTSFPLAVLSGGTGLATYSNGQLLIGNAGGLSAATLTAGTGITITNSAGGITIAATSGGGTVTSVALDGPGGIFGVTGSPVTGAGTLTLGVSGTSGGVPYFGSSTSLLSSAALAANQIVMGGGAGTAPSTLGSLGTTVTVLHGNAGGAPTFAAVSLTADVSGVLPVANGGLGISSGISGGIPGYTGTGTIASSVALTNHAIVLGRGAGATPVPAGSLGTSSTVLHGAAAGDPTFSAVSLSADVTGNLPVTNLNSGTSASSSTFWRGDGTWAAPSGSGTVTSVALTAPAVFTITGSPVTGAGTLGLVAAGTSGGIPYFDSSTTMASSAALTANRIVLGGGAGVAPAVLGSLGTTTTLLHGNAAGAPTFGAVNLAADVSGNLPVTNLNSGTSATSGTFWRGDGTWAAPSGSGTVNSGTSGQLGYYASTGTAISGDANATMSAGALTLGVTGSAQGSLLLSGATSGKVTIAAQGASGTYEFDLPTTAGSGGQVLTSAGGLGSPMTWTTPTVGTVTSVAESFTGGLISVGGSPITSAGTLALTVAGTSGGVVYFSSSSAWASSAALGANAIMVGGGAGTAPATLASLGTTTTVLHGNAAGLPSFAAISLTADVSGILPVANGGTGLSSGTSGGILGYTATGTLASSVLLTQHAIVIGAGAGATPTPLASLGTSTTVLHGAAAGDPTFGAVSLTADITGVLAGVNGGTGVANSGRTITLGGNVTTAAALTQAGAFATTITSTAISNSTLPAGTNTLAATGFSTTYSAGSSGTHTFGAVTKMARVYAYGGGGGAGGGVGGATGSGGGGGGGAGCFDTGWLPVAAFGVSGAYVVGAGGPGGAAGADGVTGGNSTFLGAASTSVTLTAGGGGHGSAGSAVASAGGGGGDTSGAGNDATGATAGTANSAGGGAGGSNATAAFVSVSCAGTGGSGSAATGTVGKASARSSGGSTGGASGGGIAAGTTSGGGLGIGHFGASGSSGGAAGGATGGNANTPNASLISGGAGAGGGGSGTTTGGNGGTGGLPGGGGGGAGAGTVTGGSGGTGGGGTLVVEEAG